MALSTVILALTQVQVLISVLRVGASEAIECSSFRQQVTANEQREFKAHLPFSVGNTKKINGCPERLIRSNDPFCNVAASAVSTSSRFKSENQGTHIFSAGNLPFKALNQPQECYQKLKIKAFKKLSNEDKTSPSLNPNDPTFLPPYLPPLPKLPPLPGLPGLPPLPGIPYLPPAGKRENVKKPAFVSVLPNPLNPPLVPNPLQPPPSLLPPVVPSPPPSIFPPVFPAPPAPTFPPVIPIPPVFNLPPFPGISTPPPPPPAFPIRFPPFPFQPTPSFPGVPPADGSGSP